MRLSFLGGAREVGKSAILVDTGMEKFVMDYGIEVQEGKHPLDPPKDLDAIFITHAHLDHSGFVPGLYSRGYNGPVYATPTTFDLCSLLLADSLKVQKKRGLESGFSSQDVKHMSKREKFMDFRRPVEFGSSSVQFLCAGHIPGAAAVHIKSRGKSLLYTGDLKFEPTQLMMGADLDCEDYDVIISESTYSYKNHPDREKLTKQLLSVVEQTCHNGGITLLPAFAVGRTQELLMMLRDVPFPVYVDGMGIKAGRRMLSHPRSFKDPGVLQQAFKRAVLVKKNADREKALRDPCVIITTAGMLSGGPVGFYISRLHDSRDCSMVLTGYQVDGTAGRNLLETGIYDNGEIEVRPQFPIHFLDFSAHTDKQHLIDFFKRANPEKVILVHGERTQEFAEELKQMGFDAYAPANGESISV